MVALARKRESKIKLRREERENKRKTMERERERGTGEQREHALDLCFAETVDQVAEGLFFRADMIGVSRPAAIAIALWQTERCGGGSRAGC